MKVLHKNVPRISLTQALSQVSSKKNKPVGEFQINGRRYQISQGTVTRTNSQSGVKGLLEGINKLIHGQNPRKSVSTMLTKALTEGLKAEKNVSVTQEPVSSKPIVALFGLKPETSLPLGWKDTPLAGAPDLAGMQVTYTDKFAEGESHISLLESANGHKLVAKIERSVAEGHLKGELDAYKQIYQTVGKHPNLVNVYGMAIVPYGSRKEEALLMDEVQGPQGNETFKLLSSALKNNTITAPEYWGAVQFTARRLLDVTGHMAAANVVHNDIKPNNIVFNKATGEPVVIDLGLHSAPNAAPKGFTQSFSPAELMSSRPNATEKSDVFLVVSSLLHGIEGLDKTPERKANEGISLRQNQMSYTLDTQGNARHKPGYHGVKTAYTEFVASVLNKDADERPDSANAQLSAFLDDRFLDDDKAKAVIQKVINSELLTKDESVRKITTKNLQEAADTLRSHLSDISAKVGMVEPMLDDLYRGSNLVNEAYKQKLPNSEKLTQLTNVIDKMHRFLPSFGDATKVTPAVVERIITNIIDVKKSILLGYLADNHTVSDTGKIGRLNQLYSTLLAVIEPINQGEASPKTYDALNHLAEVKVNTKQILEKLQTQETSLLAQLDRSIKSTAAWLPYAEKALKSFDAINPQLKAGYGPHVEHNKAMIAIHAQHAIESTLGIKADMASFVPEARVLLQQLGIEPIENVALSQQREKIRQIFTVSERLARLDKEWL